MKQFWPTFKSRFLGPNAIHQGDIFPNNICPYYDFNPWKHHQRRCGPNFTKLFWPNVFQGLCSFEPKNNFTKYCLDQNFCGITFFGPLICLEPNFLGPLISLNQTIFRTQIFINPIFFGPKIFVDQTYFWPTIFLTKISWTEIFFEAKIFWTQNFSRHKTSDLKFILIQNIFS